MSQYKLEIHPKIIYMEADGEFVWGKRVRIERTKEDFPIEPQGSE